MTDFVKKYPSKRETVFHLLSLFIFPFLLHYLAPQLFFISFFMIPTIIALNWLDGLELCRTKNKKEYIIVRTIVKLIPLLSSIIAIKLLS